MKGFALGLACEMQLGNRLREFDIMERFELQSPIFNFSAGFLYTIDKHTDNFRTNNFCCVIACKLLSCLNTGGVRKAN